jgi:ribonuclease HI
MWYWALPNKKPVLNREFWEELFSLVQGLELKWDYVEGHTGDKWNERADEIATSFADNEPVKLKK